MTPGSRDLWLLPLGGCGEIGINLNLYGHDGQWLMVDCGIGFERQAAATRVFTASADFIAARRDRLAGLLVTHAHEDHVGAVAIHWPALRCPVYCTRFTAEILKRKLAEARLLGSVPLHVVEPGAREPGAREPGARHALGPFDIQWVNLTHSTPESCALLLRTAAGTVFHTGDWKLDPEPVVGQPFDPAQLAAIGDSGVLAMVCDSTNATLEGRSASEGELYRHLLRVIGEAPRRVVVACFGSNVARLTTLVRAARAAERYPGLLGRSLERYFSAACSAGLWTLDARPIPASHLGYLPPEEVFAVATGSQGEPGAALSRLAAGTHPAMELEPDDTVIFSSRVIPGNEAALRRLVERFQAMGVRVIGGFGGGPLPEAGGAEPAAGQPVPLHASGHPARDELRDMYRWIRPEIAVPVHGAPVHLDAHAGLAKSVGVSRVLNGRNGDLFMLAPTPGIRRGAAPVGRVDIER
jgi:ribonuclease J